jgi:hypothetical protein
MAIAFAHFLDEMAAKLPATIAMMVQQDDPVATGESVASVAVDEFKKCERFLAHFANDGSMRTYIAVCESPRDDALKVFNWITEAGLGYGEKFLFAEFVGDFSDRTFLPPDMGGSDVLPLASGYLSEVMIDKMVVEVVTFVVQWRSVEEQTAFEKLLEALLDKTQF